MPVRNQSDPAKTPTNLDYVRNQIHLAHKYANARIAIERERQAVQDAILMDDSPRLVEIVNETREIEEEIEVLLKRISTARQRARAPVACPEERTRLDELNEQRETLDKERWPLVASLIKPLRAINDTARKSIVTGYQQEENAVAATEGREAGKKKLKTNDDWRRALPPGVDRRLPDLEWETSRKFNACNQEYSALGLNVGTRGHIDAALQPKKGVPAVTKFRRWNGNGHLHVKIRGGITWGEVLAGRCSQLQVRLEGRHVLLTITPDLAKKQSFTVRSHMKLDTERLPDTARITDVALLQTRVGQTYHYETMLTVDREAIVRDVPKWGVCGIDVGWRKFPRGLRVAMLTGVNRYGEPTQLELLLPPADLDALVHCTSIQSRRDVLMNEITAVIRNMDEEAVPEAVRGESKANCRSTDQLSRAIWRWEDRPAVVETWRKLNKRLENEQRHLDRRVRNRRDNCYREFSRYVADHFAHCSVEDMDLRDLHKRPTEDEDRTVYGATLRNIAAAGTLRQYLKEALELRCLECETAYTSQICNNCGTVHTDGATLSYTCPGCGTVIDQDCLASTALALANPAAANPEVLESLDRFRTVSDYRSVAGAEGARALRRELPAVGTTGNFGYADAD